MKGNIFYILFISLLLISGKVISNEECTERDGCSLTNASINVTINFTDDNPGANFYYLVRIRVETLCPSTSEWFYYTTTPMYYGYFPAVFLGFTASNIYLADEDESYYFYVIRGEVLKYSGTFPNGEFVESRQGTSYAARSGNTLTAEDIDITM